MWRLRSSTTNKCIECRIGTSRPGLFTVSVFWGSETLLEEIYPDSLSARARATDLRSRLLKHPEWRPEMTAAAPHASV
jgi:hypothetical protein